MRKEIIFAIFAGAVFGIAVAFGLWRAQFFVKDENSTEDSIANETSELSQVPSQDLELAITSHESEAVVTTSPINLEGLATPNSWVAITSQEDTVVQTSPDGVFKAEIELEETINNIIISAYNDGGQKEEESIILVYSENFEDNED